MKKIVLIITLVLIAGLGVFLWKINKMDSAQDVKHEKWLDARRPYEVKRESLLQEIENLDDNYQETTSPRATTQILFTDLNEQVYSVCYPIMKGFSYTGTLVLSSAQLPGAEGCMSTEQFRELMEAGWDVCIQWEQEMLNKRWWRNYTVQLEGLGVAQGEILYFPKGSYSAELDTKAQELGFSIVVVEREDKESPLQAQYEEGLWHVGAMGSMTVQPKLWLREAVAADANVTYLVSFHIEKQLYNSQSFRGMLNAFEQYVTSKELVVCDILTAREHYKSRLNGIAPEQVATYEAERQNLESELAKVEKKLKELDKKYQ